MTKKEVLEKRVGGRKLISAEIAPEDIKAIEYVIKVAQKDSPGLTMKHYVRMCVLQQSQIFLNDLEAQLAKHQEKEKNDAANIATSDLDKAIIVGE